MTVIDVDTHWEIPELDADQHHLGPWKDRFPSGVDRLAFGIAGDLLAALPPQRRPASKQLLAALVARASATGGWCCCIRCTRPVRPSESSGWTTSASITVWSTPGATGSCSTAREVIGRRRWLDATTSSANSSPIMPGGFTVSR